MLWFVFFPKACPATPMGTTTQLSREVSPNALPTRSATPTTSNGVERTRISRPTASIPGKSVSLTSAPITATRRPSVTSTSEKKRPRSITTAFAYS